MTQPLLEDPGSAFLASGDPERFLRDNLPLTDDPKNTEEHHHLVRAAVGIAAAVLILHRVMSREAEQAPAPLDGQAYFYRLYASHAPIWLRAALPSVTQAYRLGAVSGASIDELATAYAIDLGEHVHQTSAEAVIEGYEAQLRQGWDRQLAWTRASHAYGLDKAQMRSYLAPFSRPADFKGDLIPDISRVAVDRLMLRRADKIGDTEAWAARNVGQSFSWLIAARNGDIPAGTRKQWLTADDERVCPVCGPLHKVAIPLDERWDSTAGKLWAPGVHPNCRCRQRLLYPEVSQDWRELAIAKNAPGDPYDRDADGQFARQETRAKTGRPQVKVAEREVLPEVAALADAMKQAITEEVATTTDANPFGVSEANPFLDLAVSPFEDANPFAAANPFGAADPFGESPFEDSTPFKPKTTGKRRLILIIRPDGTEEEVEADEAEEEPIKDRMVFAPVDFYQSAWEHMKPSRAGDPAEGPEYQTGEIIDFDKWGKAAAVRGTPLPTGFPGIVGKFEHGLGQPRLNVAPVFSAISEFYNDADSQAGSNEMIMEGDYQATNSFYEQVMGDAGHWIEGSKYGGEPGLTDEEIRRIYIDAGAYDLAAIGDMPGLRIGLINAVWHEGEGPEELSESFYNYMEQNHPTEDLEEEQYLVSRSLGQDYLRVPQVFTFPDGFGGYWLDDRAGEPTPLISGKYVVDAVVKHKRPDTQNHRIKAWTEVRLKKVDSDDRAWGPGAEFKGRRVQSDQPHSEG